MLNVDLTAQFKNGEDIHFDYTQLPGDVHASGNESKKKKPKKKGANVTNATINRPDEEYPSSRVIKQGPNGDVIVESLETPAKHHHHHSDTNIWDSASIEEQENLKRFWESLGDAQKMELVKIDKKSIMEIFKNETRLSLKESVHSRAPSAKSPANNCTCAYCGRRSNVIEDELENIYDNHFDDIIDFIHEIRDINDLNALPGLLFGGFHMLEEEHKLQKRQQRLTEVVDHHHTPSNSSGKQNPIDHIHSSIPPLPTSASPPYQSKIDKINEINLGIANLGINHDHAIADLNNELEEIKLKKALEDDFDQPELTNEQRIFHKLFDPKLLETIEKLDFEKMKEANKLYNNNNLEQAYILEKAVSLKQIIVDLHKKVQLDKSMSILNDMAKRPQDGEPGAAVQATLANISPNSAEDLTVASKFNDQLTLGLSNFADDLLKNGGHSFIEMMESLSDSRNAREDLLRGEQSGTAWIDEDDEPEYLEKKHDAVNGEIPGHAYHEHGEDDDEEDEEDEDEEDEDDEEDEEDDDEYDDDDEADDHGASDTESEISEEEKMQEIRRLFLIQVIKLFQERLKGAYKEKLSEDRTQLLIEELEAEENAQREKELKKLKNKEKLKEKKKLQLLAKEEERKRLEEELQEKEQEEKRKQEALKLEQKRRKEEAKLKKEEDKKKRLEDLKKKEEEHRKKVKAQLEREEEAKKLKEERRKKAEEEKKRKEEEKRLKDVLKKQREEERERIRLEKEKFEHDEKLTLEQLSQDRFQDTRTEPEPVRAVEETVRQFTGPVSPAKNHILEQLYQARPSSGPLATMTQLQPQLQTPTLVQSQLQAQGQGQAHVLLQSQSQLLAEQAIGQSHHLHNQNSFAIPVLNNVSPSAQNSFLYGNSVGPNSATMSPWGSKTRLNSISNPAPPIFQNQFQGNSSFSPFNAESKDPFSSAPVAGGSTTSATNGVWNQAPSRNSSIWNTSGATPVPVQGLWNGGISAIGNENIPTGNGLASFGQGPGNGASLDTELIQVAASNAFQLFQNTNQLDFGVAPLISLYQSVKVILGGANLSLNQFLNACRSTLRHQFEFIYDDFGTVTHVKVEDKLQQQQQQHQQQHQQQQHQQQHQQQQQQQQQQQNQQQQQQQQQGNPTLQAFGAHSSPSPPGINANAQAGINPGVYFSQGAPNANGPSVTNGSSMFGAAQARGLWN